MVLRAGGSRPCEGTTGVFWTGSFICTYLWKLNHAGEAYFPL